MNCVTAKSHAGNGGLEIAYLWDLLLILFYLYSVNVSFGFSYDFELKWFLLVDFAPAKNFSEDAENSCVCRACNPNEGKLRTKKVKHLGPWRY